MKNILAIYQKHMLRPIIYSTFTKFVCTLCVVLLWDRFVNSRNAVPYGVVDFAFFIVGIWFLLWAWIQYLALDGMELHIFKKIAEMLKRRPKHYQRDMVDFVDEKVITFDMLDDDEQIAAKLASNVFSALLFLIPSIFVNFIF
jgi:hypothetical protein